MAYVFYKFEFIVGELDFGGFVMNFFPVWRQNPPLRSVLGIDLSRTFVRMVELSVDKNGRYALVNAASEKISSRVHSDPDDLGDISFNEMVRILRSLLKRSACLSKRAAMSLPFSLATTGKIALLESFSHSEREQQIELEIESQVPYGLDQSAWDYGILGPSFTHVGEQDVQWFAVEKKWVDDRLKLAQATQLNLAILELDSHVYDQMLSYWIAAPSSLSSNATVAILEIGETSSKLRGLCQREWVFERELTLAKHDWQSPHFEVTTQTWTQEVKAALDALVFQSSAFPCKNLLLTGDVSDLWVIEQWKAHFAKVVNLEITWLNPFKDILQIKSALPDVCSSDLSAQQYMQACGLALRLLI